MATTVERTPDEIGLDLTGVDFCTTDLLALPRSVLKFPDRVGELSGSPGMISGVSVHSGYDTSWMLLAPQASSSVTVLLLDKRRIVLSSPIWKKIQMCLLSLQNHLWAHSPGWCKSPRCLPLGYNWYDSSTDLSWPHTCLGCAHLPLSWVRRLVSSSTRFSCCGYSIAVPLAPMEVAQTPFSRTPSLLLL